MVWTIPGGQVKITFRLLERHSSMVMLSVLDFASLKTFASSALGGWPWKRLGSQHSRLLGSIMDLR
jgi:hypothetical protein